MNKIKTQYVCQNCGNVSAKWMGKCQSCDSWNSIVEEDRISKISKINNNLRDALPLGCIDLKEDKRSLINISEFDRVLGGGVVTGSLVLIGGEPGIGKSTLLLQAANSFSIKNGKVLYISGEESENQISGRGKRLNISSEQILLLNETNLENIKEQIVKENPKLVIIDSIQTTFTPGVAAIPGSISQIREVCYELMDLAKSKNVAIFVVGHITKDGDIAGPKILEHMVDAVFYFEGSSSNEYRILRAHKNRFGSTNEIGLFEMTELGLREISNPSTYFASLDLSDNYGRALSCFMEGNRALFVEIQSLVVENKIGNCRRTTQGFDSNRLSMLIAVIEKYMGIKLSYHDVYLNITGGVKIIDRCIDLAVIASIVSSVVEKKWPQNIIFLGEVGLSGEIRPVSRLEQRIKELEKFNYKKIIMSIYDKDKITSKSTGLEIIHLKNVTDCLNILGI